MLLNLKLRSKGDSHMPLHTNTCEGKKSTAIDNAFNHTGHPAIRIHPSVVFTPSVVDSVQFGHAVDLDFGINLVLVTPRVGRAPGVSPKNPVKVKSEWFVTSFETSDEA